MHGFEALRDTNFDDVEHKPNTEDVLERLIDVGGDLGELKERFYPLLALDTSAMSPEAIVEMLASAFNTYYADTDDIDKKASVKDLRGRAGRFIDALVPQKKKAEGTKRLWYKGNPQDFSSLMA